MKKSMPKDAYELFWYLQQVFWSPVYVTSPLPSVYLFQLDSATLKDKNKMQAHLVV